MKCDGCGKEIAKGETRYMNIKMCCSVTRVPLCRVCWEKTKREMQATRPENCHGNG